MEIVNERLAEVLVHCEENLERGAIVVNEAKIGKTIANLTKNFGRRA